MSGVTITGRTGVVDLTDPIEAYKKRNDPVCEVAGEVLKGGVKAVLDHHSPVVDLATTKLGEAVSKKFPTYANVINPIIKVVVKEADKACTEALKPRVSGCVDGCITYSKQASNKCGGYCC